MCWRLAPSDYSRSRSSRPKRPVVEPPRRIARSLQENPAMTIAGRRTTHYDQIELLILLTLCELFPHASRRRTASSRPAPALAARTSGPGGAAAPCCKQSCALRSFRAGIARAEPGCLAQDTRTPSVLRLDAGHAAEPDRASAADLCLAQWRAGEVLCRQLLDGSRGAHALQRAVPPGCVACPARHQELGGQPQSGG